MSWTKNRRFQFQQNGTGHVLRHLVFQIVRQSSADLNACLNMRARGRTPSSALSWSCVTRLCGLCENSTIKRLSARHRAHVSMTCHSLFLMATDARHVGPGRKTSDAGTRATDLTMTDTQHDQRTDGMSFVFCTRMVGKPTETMRRKETYRENGRERLKILR